jgi:hypothetical protein
MIKPKVKDNAIIWPGENTLTIMLPSLQGINIGVITQPDDEINVVFCLDDYPLDG